jgi:aldehyde:ferredoxin oxidoreductase
MIYDIRGLAHLVKLCDCFGLDSMSTGGVIGFVFEAAQKGIIRAPEGIRLDFGSIEGAEYLIKAIAYKEGELGQLLSQGVKRASEKLEGGSDDFAVHVKGLECPAWGPRGTPGMGLAYMTADRGGCHQRGFMVAYEVGGAEYEDKPVEAHSLKKKAEMLIGLQNYLAGTDTLVKCDFGGFGVSPESYALLLSAATGRKVKPAFFDELGERVWNQTRLFNNREGFDCVQDRLPKRFVVEPLPSGPHKGHRITEEDMNYLRVDYYKVRGWDKMGKPKPETLKRVGLNKDLEFSINQSN